MQSEERHRGELQALQSDLGNARQLVGELKGSQQELSRAIGSARSDLEATKIDLHSSQEAARLAAAEASALRLRLIDLEGAIKETTKPVKRRAIARKPIVQ